ncbi:hypothetical protein PHET_00565 [Paragonimus heterotremus]|uniref:Uncharacterized protein n=1 Tax=Paragonimus heterotremus TaxID=100268 RepID=A0A8J4STG4_9TREM|nr:hypothetical protein PHET_00565 [Paragonimus heterotremus]
MRNNCSVTEPQRIPLIESRLSSDIPSEFTAAINLLRSVRFVTIELIMFPQTTDESLFLWKDFPITLPETILNVCNLSVDSIFIAPEFDECELLSKDSLGNLKPLSRHQLSQLRQKAQFDVESSNFPGQAHTWKISPFFLKGKENVQITLKKDLYRALAQLVIHAYDRIVGDYFSIRSGLSALYRDSFCMAIDLLFGWPRINHGNVDQKLMEERLRFITCELSVKSSHRKRVMDFWDAYEQYMYFPRDAPLDHQEHKHPPYRFITPARIPIDLRLHSSALLDRCLAVIHELRQPARAEWFPDFKERAISRLRDEGKSISEIKRLVRQEGLWHYASRLFDAMRQHSSLQSISNGIAEPLIQQATFNLILAEAKETFTHAWLTYQENADQELRKHHPILYNITEWRSRKMAKLQQQYFETHRFDVHEFVLSKCTQRGLDQHAFFIGRDLTFLRDRERLLRGQLEKSASFPDTQYIFRVPAQLLRHWRVYRRNVAFTTNYELVDTVLLSRRPSAAEPVPPVKRSIKHAAIRAHCSYEAVSIAYPRKPPRTDQELGPQDFDVHTTSPKHVFHQPDTPFLDLSPDEETNLLPQPVLSEENVSKSPHRREFVVQSSLVYKASTRYFMWRWLAFFVCTYSWLLRCGQLFFITIPFRSAFSLTVLVQPSPIYLKLELDQTTGYLYYNKNFFQDTLVSRIRRMWREIRESRRAFDSTPSKGMLDKAAARPLHRVWSYVFRGFLTTVFLLILWPPLCVIVSAISVLIGLTLPLAIPFISLIAHILGLLFCDAYKPASKSNNLFPSGELIVGHFLIRFVLQSTFAVITAFAICPIWFIVRILWAFVRYIMRSIWDALVFHLVLRRLARIPAREDFMVKRIAGPGTAANHFYQARPVDILVILVGQLELLELRLWRRQMEQIADKPMEAYRRLVHGLSWLSLVPKSDGDVYGTLCRCTKSWRSQIQSKADERVQALQIHLKPHQLQRIKLSDGDLHRTLRTGAELTERFFQARIADRLQLLGQDRASWWANFALNTDDFLGLCTSLLGRTFGEQIFTCITETDTVFPLQVREPSLTRYFQEFMIRMVSGRASIRSLDGSGLDRHMELNLYGTGNNDDEALSLASDAVVSSGDAISQRCTVIAVSSSKPDGDFPSPTYVEVNEPGEELPSGLKLNRQSNKDLAVTFAFPNTPWNTQRRAVPDPVAFIHIDLPLFPLSAFAPSSCRQLPLPLKSYPKPPNVNPLSCLSSRRLHRLCSGCICPTKASLDRDQLSKLAERLVSSTPPECMCGETEQHNGVALYPVRTGLATLLADEERNLRHRIQSSSCPVEQTACDSIETHLSVGSPLVPSAAFIRCPVHGPRLVPRLRRAFWKRLFCRTNAPLLPKWSIFTVVENLGRVYHPAIITLLMHARDREHNPLDFSHPAIQTAINVITTPQYKQTGLPTDCIHSRSNTDAPGPTSKVIASLYPSQLALSLGSELAKDVHMEQTRNLRTTEKLGCVRADYRNILSTSVAGVSHSSGLFDSSASRSVLLEPRRELRLEHAASMEAYGPTDIQMSPIGGTQRELSIAALRGDVDPGTSNISHGNLNPVVLFGWDTTSAVMAGYGSGVESVGYEPCGYEHSAGSPTGSLYGTEDAVTTEDLDEEDDEDEEAVDALSLSSLNQTNLVNSLFPGSSVSTKHDLFDPVGHPYCLPLAVPELLTASVTTSGSAEVEFIPEGGPNINPIESQDLSSVAATVVPLTPMGSSSPGCLKSRKVNGSSLPSRHVSPILTESPHPDLIAGMLNQKIEDPLRTSSPSECSCTPFDDTSELSVPDKVEPTHADVDTPALIDQEDENALSSVLIV